MSKSKRYTRRLDQLSNDDVSLVGGKNASLGEMIQTLKKEGIRVPGGFATTADGYWQYLDENDLDDKIVEQLEKMDEDGQSLEKTGKAIRRLLREGEFPDKIADAIRSSYQEMQERYETDDLAVAVRSSATAEDLPDASFAGQQETFLNISGEDDLLDACRKCYASLFTDRAISYRQEKGFDQMKVALSIGVQKMVRSDKAGSGVMFSIDTESGFPDVVVIDATWGLGENVVQGTVNPDQYRVFKPLLKDEKLAPIIERSLGDKEKSMVYANGGNQTTKNVNTPKKKRRRFVLGDDEILQLARWGTAIEKHYDKPMDMEWAKDGETNEYADLIGGQQFEEEEANPMLGFRGASRYYHDRYREGFALECRALLHARRQLGFRNLIVMVPFCRTLEEADKVLEVMAKNGLERGQKGLEVYVMCEIPSNVVLAEEFGKRFDGFSIGSNDLTQLVLGIDRDSSVLSELFDERNEAVKETVRQVIRRAHKADRKVGICGQAPSDYPDFAAFLVREGIDSISLNPDSVIEVKRKVAEIEADKS